MKIDRKEHPILTRTDFEQFLDQLTELEMKSLREAIEDWSEFDTMFPPQFNESEINSAISDVTSAIGELESVEQTLKSWIKKRKSSVSRPSPQKNGK
jgi:hypothetical protein